MGGVHQQHIHASLDQRRYPVVGVLAGADSGADAKLSQVVLAGVRKSLRLGDVLHGHHAGEPGAAVGNQNLLDAMPVQKVGDLIESRALGGGDEALLRRHHFGDGCIEPLLETDVAAGDDTEQLVALHNGHARNVVFGRQREQVAHGAFRSDRHGIADDAALELLYRPDLARLAFERHVLVHDTYAALLCHGDGQAPLGDGVHGSGHQGNVEADVACQAGSEVDFGGQNARIRRQEQDIVER